MFLLLNVVMARLKAVKLAMMVILCLEMVVVISVRLSQIMFVILLPKNQSVV